jgi:methionyl aminopeptidase
MSFGTTWGIYLESDVLEYYRKAGRVAGEAREYGASLIAPGVKALDVVTKIEEYVTGHGAQIAFPSTLSINDMAAHYTPKHDDTLTFRKGDLVKVDVGAHVEGYIGDTAMTVEVGGTNHYTMLREAVEDALDIAIGLLQPKAPLNLIGGAIEQTIESFGFKPISNLTGHSLKQYVLHAGLSVPNIRDMTSDRVKEGDVLAVEPFATTGVGKVDGRKPGNIYRMGRIKSTKYRKVVEFIQINYRTLPFAERWLYPHVKHLGFTLNSLIRNGIIQPYSILSEISKGMVSQKEHTVIITRDGCEVTTDVTGTYGSVRNR